VQGDGNAAADQLGGTQIGNDEGIGTRQIRLLRRAAQLLRFFIVNERVGGEIDLCAKGVGKGNALP